MGVRSKKATLHLAADLRGVRGVLFLPLCSYSDSPKGGGHEGKKPETRRAGNPNGKKPLSSAGFLLDAVSLKKQTPRPQYCPAVEHIMNHINTSLFVNQSLFLSLMELVSQASL